MDAQIDPHALAPAPGNHKPGAAAAAVTKKLAAGAAGTRRLQARFGTALVCVRYREGASGRRYTTVELEVDERPGMPGFSWVRIDYRETALRQQVKAAGGVWDAQKKLWHLPKTVVRILKLKDRVVSANSQIRKTGLA